VLVQFSSPPQALLAARSDIRSVTAMDPEEAMRRLAAGEADAAYIWGPSAAWINRSQLNDRFKVVMVEAPQMQFPAAIGLSSKQSALRDEVDSVLAALAPRIRELKAKYAVATTPPLLLAAAGPVAIGEPSPRPLQAEGVKADLAKGKEVFNGTCAHCHGPNGVVEDRKINLRRLQVKYDALMEETFFTTVTNGRPAKGMPAWKEVYTTQDFVNILAYLKTIQDK
jgi:mono/diheme cytochrome c family protein